MTHVPGHLWYPCGAPGAASDRSVHPTLLPLPLPPMAFTRTGAAALPAVLSAALATALASPALCQTLEESRTLVAGATAANHSFGSAVAIDQDVAVVGAPSLNVPPSTFNAGAAYLFDAQSGQELFALAPSTTNSLQSFGDAVHIVGNVVIVGAPGDSENGSFAGAAYVFDATTGAEIYKLLPDDGTGAEYFGKSVALAPDGSHAVVGAPFSNLPDNAAGKAYVFDLTTGKQVYDLVSPDVEATDYFGASVAIAGGLVLVGETDLAGAGPAAVHLFDLDDGDHDGALTSPQAGGSDAFGSSVAVEDDRVLVGAPWAAPNGTRSGAVYLFDLGSRNLLGSFDASDGQADMEYGHAIHMAGGIAVVGTQTGGPGGPVGAAYILDIENGQELLRLGASFDLDGAYFGQDVAISKFGALVGAQGAFGEGRALVYDAADCDGDGELDWQTVGTGAVADCDDNGIPDACDLQVPMNDLDGDGQLDACINPPLYTTAFEVSLTAAGEQPLQLAAGASQAQRPFVLLGSASGTSPGVVDPATGTTIPLNVDPYFQLLAFNAGAGIVLPWIGSLNAGGKAVARVALPTLTSAQILGLVGTTLHHAFITIDVGGTGQIAFVSNPLPLVLVL